MSDDVTKAKELAWSDEVCTLVDTAFDHVSRNPSDYETVLAYRLAIIAARDQGYNEGIEAAARYIQDQYPHDKRVLVPAIRKIGRPQG